MIEKKLNPYEKKEKVLKRKLLSVARSIAKIEFPSKQVDDTNARYCFNGLEKGLKNFIEFFGYGSNKTEFKALKKVINAELLVFIRNFCFAKTYRYLTKLKDILDNCSDLKGEIIGKTIDMSNIDMLIETFKFYTRDLPEECKRYEYIKKYKAENLGWLYQTWVDSELFTALFEFRRAKDEEVKDLLLRKIKLEINESVKRKGYNLTEKIKDQSHLFWALETILLNDQKKVEIMDSIKDLEEFKKCISMLIKRSIRYPDSRELRNENTIEIQGVYRTRVYSFQSLIGIYNFFIEFKDSNKNKKFLHELASYIERNAGKLLSSKECKRNSKNLYYLCLQLETLYKFMKTKKIEEIYPKTIKKKKSKRKEVEPKEEIEEGKLEYEVWDVRGKKQVSQKKVEELKGNNKKSKFEIFVDEDGAVYFYGKKVVALKKAQILYNFLLYFLKNKGYGGTYKTLYFGVWLEGKEKEINSSFEFNDSYKQRVIRTKNRLQTLFKHNELGKIMYEYNKYRLPEDFEFYVIEKI